MALIVPMDTPTTCPKGHTNIESSQWWWTCLDCNWMLDKHIEAQCWMNAERGYEATRRVCESLPPWSEISDEAKRAVVDYWANRG